MGYDPGESDLRHPVRSLCCQAEKFVLNIAAHEDPLKVFEQKGGTELCNLGAQRALEAFGCPHSLTSLSAKSWLGCSFLTVMRIK